MRLEGNFEDVRPLLPVQAVLYRLRSSHVLVCMHGYLSISNHAPRAHTPPVAC